MTTVRKKEDYQRGEGRESKTQRRIHTDKEQSRETSTDKKRNGDFTG